MLIGLITAARLGWLFGDAILSYLLSFGGNLMFIISSLSFLAFKTALSIDACSVEPRVFVSSSVYCYRANCATYIFFDECP